MGIIQAVFAAVLVLAASDAKPRLASSEFP